MRMLGVVQGGELVHGSSYEALTLWVRQIVRPSTMDLLECSGAQQPWSPPALVDTSHLRLAGWGSDVHERRPHSGGLCLGIS